MLSKQSKILVVDDMGAMRTRVQNQLKNLGFLNVEFASDGLEAFNIIQRTITSANQIELVLCDWNMPQMTGIELLEIVRANPRYSSMPFIMMTAEGEKLQVVRAVNSGVTDYLIKPVDKSVLEQKLNALMINQIAG